MNFAAILPEKLGEYLAARECVAFVGAGFSMACGMPGWGKLSEDLLTEAAKGITTPEKKARLRDCRAALKVGRFATAASGIRGLLTKEQLHKLLTAAFDVAKLDDLDANKKKRMLSRMENLVLGPWAGIITTNFDGLIESGFNRFVTGKSPLRCEGNQNVLGSILCLPPGVGGFMVKLHGETWADKQVLSSADYVDAWLLSPKIRRFLTAIMLRYRLVFIGCSLEDEILRLRMGLCAEFDNALPQAYALLPDLPVNRLRRWELEKEAGILPLSYPPKAKGHPDHYAVDEFLAWARKFADFRGEPTTLGALKSRPLPERLEAIGAINRHLLAVLNRLEQGRLQYTLALDPEFDQVLQGKSRHVLSTLSEGERLYRLLFLVSLDLVREVTQAGTKYFQITPGLRAHLQKMPLVEGA
jgi:hypothetical protein